MSKVFKHSLHKELWQWLGDNPEKDKEDWHRWESNGGDVKRASSWCFACEYVLGCINGKRCPLKWSLGSCMQSDKSEYEQWIYAKTNTERTRLAYAIRDLPVKDGVVCE